MSAKPSADELVDEGIAFAQAHRSEQAIACFDRALALNPRLGEAWYIKGLLLGKTMRFRDALACFEKAHGFGVQQAALMMAVALKGMESQGEKPPVDIEVVDQREDEQFALRLAKLVRAASTLQAKKPVGYAKTSEEIRKLGEQLCANGGDARMQRIAERVRALGGSVRQLELSWNGICG